uniref:ATP synthase subunit a n=1 Tax=Lycostomus sp. YXY-2021 TaxID=2806917 RepID=A0A888YLU9_9COLE|nr:ATP synthase F0 subunit 6 [Lycostomus sp. YXY-2021]
MNLFSTFDPATSIGSLNWTSTILPIIIIPSMYWIIPSRMNFLWNKVINTLNNEFKILLKMEKMKGSTLLFISLFAFIMFNNTLSLFPYIFSSTSHLTLTLSMALPLWLSFMIYGWLNETKHMFAHLVPQGTPPILMPFMVCIETISNIIRPGTLAIRLTANLIAGHLLLTLLGNSANSISEFMISLLIMVQILLLILESAVSIIQAYVFSILVTLYSSEIN